MTITINNKDYNLKYTIRALFIFEQIKGEPFGLKTYSDYYIFFYCLLAASNPDMDLTFDQLIDELDKDNSIVEQLFQFLKSEEAKNGVFNGKGGDNSKKKA